MTDSDAGPPPKRLRILEDEEIDALYARPHFTADERTEYFALTPHEQELCLSFERVPVQLFFILQLGYFKAKPKRCT